jgi:hypothetical protein
METYDFRLMWAGDETFGIVAVEGASRSTEPGLAHLGGIRLGVVWSGR